MRLVRVLAVLKATEIVARRCIFAERGALEDGHPIVARRSGAARRVDTSMSILGRRIQKGFSTRVMYVWECIVVSFTARTNGTHLS